jgi:multisubunit Na+/H+ antiporter MnhB subunit
MLEIMIIVYALLIFMILASLIAVETRDLLSSVICVGAAGFGLSLLDLFLGAPDLAITQLVVEVFILVILIRVVITRRDETHETPKDTLGVAVVVLALAAVLACSYTAMKGMNEFGQPLLAQHGREGVAAEYLEGTLEDTGATNSVMAVLLDYRAYDTLGEATVIFAAVIATYAVLRHVGRKKKEEQNI